MFFSVARLRLPLASLLLLPALARAHEDALFTSSVTYCAPPEAILVQQFDVAYFAANSSVNFNISAASVLPNLNVSATLYLNVYGMQPVNLTVDICSLFGGALCPLPMYNFVGWDSIPLPPSLDVASKLPGIAYKIPDLEAFAQLTLVEVGTNEVKACVQSTLSNGWSAHQRGVEWTTAAMALLALVAAVWQSIMTDALALLPVRLLDLIYLYQTIAASGLLGLNYPVVYRAFTLNFAWALGLFAASPSSHIQNSINNMRHLTGGNLADASSGGAVPLVNRKMSPYNLPPSNTFLAPQSLLARVASLPKMDLVKRGVEHMARTTVADNKVLVGGDVATVTPQSSNVLQPGIPIYVNSIGIATANAFMTIFLIGLIYAAIVLAALALAYGVAVWLGRTKSGRNSDRLTDFRQEYAAWARAWGLRAVLAAVIPVLIFSFYQWTLKDSWLSVLLSVITLLAISAIVLYSYYLILRTAVQARSSPSPPAPSPSTIPLAAPYAPHRAWYIVPLLLAVLVKALVTAFASSTGLAQAVIFLVTDALVFISLVIFKPYRTRHADILMGFLGIVRMVCSGLLIAFAQSLELKPIPRVVIGIISAIIFSVAVLVMFFNIFVNMGLWRLLTDVICCGRRRRAGNRALASNPSHHGSDPSILEKGGSAGASQQQVNRPGNPTPPASESLTPITPGSEWSAFTDTTGTTTLGEPLPRRWSFQHSRPPSASAESPSASSPQSPRWSGTTSPSTYLSALPSQRHSRRVSSSAPSPIEPIDEHCAPEEPA
ncbi:TRP-domain-containing protein [Obba rivulosa]|uniref:TRP-domain-containing protein n=1 Tax=Obba rivulosa TaxID=1052685 RepID=A0A8E2ATA0_9APHY|nr:TRP-domain-containing protein [Obba rivulosa]